jgi:bacillithiol biosynthesis deacetylase BshB1
MSETTVDVLAVGAHPDDVELAMGGTLLKLASLGYRTGILDMTRGEAGTRGTLEERAREAQEAARTVRETLGLPDSRVRCDDEARRAFVRVVRRFRPKVVFTHYWEDPHPDHAHTSRIVREAVFLAGLPKYDPETGRARHRPNALAYFLFPRTIPPSFIVDITAFAEEKLRAIRAHRSQLYDHTRPEPETRISSEGFLRRVEARQRYYGALIDVEHGEAFLVREALNVEDPVALLTRSMNIYSYFI